MRAADLTLRMYSMVGTGASEQQAYSFGTRAPSPLITFQLGLLIDSCAAGKKTQRGRGFQGMNLFHHFLWGGGLTVPRPTQTRLRQSLRSQRLRSAVRAVTP